MKKLVDGVLVDMTADEIAARQAQEAANAKQGLIDYAYEQSARRTAPITLDDNGNPRTFTPNDTFVSRLHGKIRTLEERGDTTTKWIFNTGTATVSLAFLKSMALATDDQWQPYFDTVESVIIAIQAGSITTKAQIEAAFDAVYAGD